MLPEALRILIPSIVAFAIGIGSTPFISYHLYDQRAWKRTRRDDITTNPNINSEFKRIANGDQEVSTPRLGGLVIIWSVVVTCFMIWLLAVTIPDIANSRINFLSRGQTLLPIFALIVGALIGFVEDLFEIRADPEHFPQGLPGWHKVAIVAILGLVTALWFFAKLDMSSISIPFGNSLELGFWFIPLFIAVMLGCFSSGVIDGIDGLAGGVLATIFGSLALIAFTQNQIDLSALSLVITGGILAFLWFNVPPARFYMGETGMLGLTLALAVIVFLTDTVLVLPIIALPLVITSLSVIIQKASRKFRNGKNVFKIAPLHHHFQALGWSNEKVTMRYWIVSVISAILGVIIAIVGA